MATHTFTREELYELVWSEPVMKLAKRYGVSDRGFAKACAKANVPVPARGYWARLAAGQKQKRAPLPPRGNLPERITISPVEPYFRKPPPTVPVSVQAIIEQEHKASKVLVSTALSKPHKIVAAWIVQDSASSRTQNDFAAFRQGDQLPISGTALAQRRFRILDALLKALEQRGYRLESSTERHSDFLATWDHQQVSVRLRERIRQFRRELTAEEIRQAARFSMPRKWAQERVRSGGLVLKVAVGYRDNEWRDTPERSLEEQLNDALGGIGALIEEHRLQRAREQAEAEKRRIAEEERIRRERAHQREMMRFQKLVEKVNAWRTASEIRAFVEAVEHSNASNAAGDAEAFSDWKRWALEHADRIDPLRRSSPID